MVTEHPPYGLQLTFEHGLFRDVSPQDPLQLYQMTEKEQFAGVTFLDGSDFAHGGNLLCCTAGQGTAKTEEKAWHLTEGTLLYLPNVPCSLETASSVGRLRVVALTVCFFPPPDSLPHRALYRFFMEKPDPAAVQGGTRMSGLYASLVNELCAPRIMTSSVRGYIEQILVLTYRGLVAHLPPEVQEEPDVTAVGNTAYAVIRYVDDHLTDLHNLMHMAQELGYNYDYLSHLFHRKTGLTIQKYVSLKKIEKGRQMLRDTSLSIVEISSALNYDCVQSFSKAFKRVTHMSPTEYRRCIGN